MAAAFATIACFSSSERTGPFNVTVPFLTMTFMLWAYVDKESSLTIVCRICFARSRSDVCSDCWSAVRSEAVYPVHLLLYCPVQSDWERPEPRSPSTPVERKPLFQLPSSSFLFLPVAYKPSHALASNRIGRGGHIGGCFPVRSECYRRLKRGTGHQGSSRSDRQSLALMGRVLRILSFTTQEWY